MRAEQFEYFAPAFIGFAHRGGAIYPPNEHRENSAHAFAQAVALGYRYLETDVHATADGVLLAFHDDELDRVTDRVGKIAELTWTEIGSARIHGIDPIPRFEELLTDFPDARFNIDAKSEASVDLLADLILQHGAQDRVCVNSFGVRRLHRLRKRLGPGVASGVSALGIALYAFAPWLTRFVDSRGVALQMPLEQKVGPFRLRLFTPSLVRAAHARGKKVQIWTVDDAATMNALIDAGADGIFTDRIDVLKSVLQARGLWAGNDVTEATDQ